MPVRRTKSCHSCRAAKARCSLSAPCSRCTKRFLECSYSPLRQEHRRTEGFRSIRPAATAIKVSNDTSKTPVPTVKAVAASSISDEATRSEGAEFRSLPLTTRPDLTLPPFDSQMLVDDPSALSLPLHSFGLSYSGSISSSLDDSLPHPLVFDFDRQLIAKEPITVDCVDSQHDVHDSERSASSLVPHSVRVVANGKALGPQLSQRARTLQQGSLTAKMVFSRLTEYTRMLSDGIVLPPFIYAPCALGRDYECRPDLPHQCLPETLAICANLSHMFYSSLPGSHSFVWQQICTHVRQMRMEYENYDEQKLLQAMQAAVVYGMLCSQCTESVSREDAAWLVATSEMFGFRLFDICAFAFNADHLCSSRTEWILVESMRRIGCLLYFIDLLLQTDAQAPSSGECPEFFEMPLPCFRELWQSSTNTEWETRYQKVLNTKAKKGRRGLTFRHLLMLRRSSMYGDNAVNLESADLAEHLAEWCERVDDLSMLLWMAFTIEGEGQAPEISRT